MDLLELSRHMFGGAEEASTRMDDGLVDPLVDPLAHLPADDELVTVTPERERSAKRAWDIDNNARLKKDMSVSMKDAWRGAGTRGKRVAWRPKNRQGESSDDARRDVEASAFGYQTGGSTSSDVWSIKGTKIGRNVMGGVDKVTGAFGRVGSSIENKLAKSKLGKLFADEPVDDDEDEFELRPGEWDLRSDERREADENRKKNRDPKALIKGAFSADSVHFGRLGDESALDIGGYGTDRSTQNWGTGTATGTGNFVGDDGTKHTDAYAAARLGVSRGGGVLNRREARDGSFEEAGASGSAWAGMQANASARTFTGSTVGASASADARIGAGAEGGVGAKRKKMLGGGVSGLTEAGVEGSAFVGARASASGEARASWSKGAEATGTASAGVLAELEGSGAAQAMLQVGGNDLVGVRGSGSGKLSAGAEANAMGKVTAKLTGVTAQGSADAKAGASASGAFGVGATAGFADVDLVGDGEAFAGAEAEANGQASIGLTGAKLKGAANAFAGAKAEGQIGTEFGACGLNLGKLMVKGSAMAGAGANASVNLTAENGTVSAGAEAGAAVGVGAGLGMDFKTDLAFVPRLALDQLKKNGIQVGSLVGKAAVSSKDWLIHQLGDVPAKLAPPAQAGVAPRSAGLGEFSTAGAARASASGAPGEMLSAGLGGALSAGSPAAAMSAGMAGGTLLAADPAATMSAGMAGGALSAGSPAAARSAGMVGGALPAGSTAAAMASPGVVAAIAPEGLGQFSTADEALASLSGAPAAELSAGMDDATSLVGDAVNDALSGTSKTVSKGMGLLDRIMPTLLKGFTDAEGAHESALQSIQDLIFSATGEAEALGKSLMSIGASALSELRSLITLDPVKLLEMDWEDRVDEIIARVRAMVDEVKQGVLGIIERTHQAIIKVGLKLGKVIVAPVRMAANGVGDIIGDFGALLVDAGNDTVDTLMDAFATAEEGVLVPALGVKLALPFPVTPTIGQARGGLSGAGSFFDGAASGSFGGAVDGIAETVGRGLFEDAPGMIGDMGEQVLGDFEHAERSVLDPIESVVREATNVVAPAVNAARDVVLEAKKVADNAVNTVSSVANTVSNVATDVVNTVGNFFKGW